MWTIVVLMVFFTCMVSMGVGACRQYLIKRSERLAVQAAYQQRVALQREKERKEQREKELQREIYGTTMLQVVQAAERRGQDEYDEYHKDDPEVVAEREAKKAKIRQAVAAELDSVKAAEREQQEKDLAAFAEWVAQQAWKENFDKQRVIRNALEPFGSPVYDKFRPGAEVDSYSLDEVQSIEPLEGDWDELITHGNDLAIYDPTCHYCKVTQLKPAPDGNGHVGVLQPCERHVYRVEDNDE